MARRRVLIVGGGYGGLACMRRLARRLKRPDYEITLVDATPDHTIKTRFHERAVLPSREFLIRFPLPALAKASGANFVMDRIHGVDFDRRTLVGEEHEHPYERLVIAAGGQTVYFGVEGAEQNTVSLQTYTAAADCARRVRQLGIGRPHGTPRRVAVCGAGIEGLEVAAMLRQAAKPQDCEITVVERSDTVMARSQCRESQRVYIRQFLKRRGIRLLTGSAIERVQEDSVLLANGDQLPTDLVYWCSGVRRVNLGGTPTGEPFTVSRYLQSPEHPDVFALGDFATVDSPDQFANLGSAQRAIFHGEAVADNLWRYESLRALRPVRYRPAGEVIGLGDLDGVGTLFGVPLRGLRAATAKKAIEGRYLTELFRDLPRAVVRGLRRSGRNAGKTV